MDNRAPLRILAAIGYLGMLFQGEFFVEGPRPDSEFVYVFLSIAAGAVVLFGPAKAGFARLRANWDLVVPYGCYQAATLALTALPWEPMQISLTSPFADFALIAFLLLVATILLEAAFVIWMTVLIIQLVTRDTCDPMAAFKSIGTWFGRGTALLVVAFVGLMLPLAFVALVVAGSPGLLAFALILVGAYGVIYNLATAAWFPLALRTEMPFVEAIKQSTLACWHLKREWGLLLGSWMLALGFLTLHAFVVSGGGRTSSNNSWKVNLDWLGGYPDRCQWYEGLCSAAEVSREAIASIPITLLFAAVAISVKIVIIEKLASMGILGSMIEVEDVGERFDP